MEQTAYFFCSVNQLQMAVTLYIINDYFGWIYAMDFNQLRNKDERKLVS